MPQSRAVTKIIEATSRREGPAIVHRALPSEDLPFLDPFLAIGEFRMPAMKPGFGFHSHSGVEFITYQLDGELMHSDPQGTSIVLKGGEAMHLVAGANMVHGETPVGEGESHGIQLWVDLPKANKKDEYSYKKAAKEIIPVNSRNGVTIRTIASIDGPLTLNTPAIYLDISMDKGTAFQHTMSENWNAFILVLSGEGYFGTSKEMAKKNELLVFGHGGSVDVSTTNGLRFLLLAAQPLNEGGRGMFE